MSLNEDPIFRCLRCGYETIVKCNMIKHINRQKNMQFKFE